MASKNNPTNYYISSLLQKLQSSSTSSVQKALISLSRATRKNENVIKLRDKGGISLLLEFLKSSNKKDLDMAVSVLANCALEKQCRLEIKQHSGPDLLCKLLASLADTSILSRVTRALANLSQDVTIANEIVTLNAVPKLLSILKESTDVHLLQNTLRALRILGKSDAYVKVLAESGEMLNFVELLRNESDHEIKRCCLQTLFELIKVANGVLATHVQEQGGIEVICQLSYSDDRDISKTCINILCTLTRYTSVRVTVGTMGGIEAFIHQIQEKGPLWLQSVEGICRCCREAVNRNMVRSCGGLEVLLGMLHFPKYSRIFDDILDAFVCFTYDDLALKRMLAGGLIPILVSMLKKLLFPDVATDVVAGKPDKDLSTNDKTAVTIGTEGNTSSKSPESVAKPNSSAAPLSSSSSDRTTSSNASSRLSENIPKATALRSTTLPSLFLPEINYPYSPPSSISPNLSPELRVPYLSPCSPQSIRSASPMVYSPSGSEIDYDSSESESNPEQSAMENNNAPDIEESQNLGISNPNDLAVPNSCGTENAMNLPEEEASVLIKSDLTVTKKDLHNPLMEDLVATRSETTATASEGSSLHDDGASGSGAGVPLLQGSNYNEHFRLFLPDENLFSADQPSPRKTQGHATSSIAWTRRQRSRESPEASKTPNSSPQMSSSSSLQGTEHKIIYLLSRFGQMPDATDSEALTSPECIQTLLDYLCYSKNTDTRCLRILRRLACDRKFFETLVIVMFPGAVYRQLICGLRPGYLFCSQSQDSRSSTDDKLMESTGRTTEASPTTISNRPSAEEHVDVESSGCRSSKTESSEQAEGQIENNDIRTNLAFSDVADGDTTTRANDSSRNDTDSIGKSLLLVLTTQASTSFGEGILAHLLLRGTPKQKEACALSLPFLCKLLRMKQKLLVDHKGIMVILSILCNSSEKVDIIRAINCITYLVANSALKMDTDFDVFIAKDENGLPFLTSKEEARGDDRNNTQTKPVLEDNSADRKGGDDSVTRASTEKKEEEASCVEVKKTEACRSLLNQLDGSSERALKRLAGELSGFGCKRSKVESNSAEIESCFGNCSYSQAHATPFDVAVKVESEESIGAHRSVLSALSEVFKAMLSSNFVEAAQSEIVVKDLSHASALFLVHYAYGCTWSPENRSTSCPLLEKSLSLVTSPQSERLVTDFDFLFELLACADRFLLTDLKKQCEQLMMYSLTGERVVDTYLVAVYYNTPRLRVYSLQFIFLQELDLSCVYDCVTGLLNSPEKNRVIEDFKCMALDCCS